MCSPLLVRYHSIKMAAVIIVILMDITVSWQTINAVKLPYSWRQSGQGPSERVHVLICCNKILVYVRYGVQLHKSQEKVECAEDLSCDSSWIIKAMHCCNDQCPEGAQYLSVLVSKKQAFFFFLAFTIWENNFSYMISRNIKYFTSRVTFLMLVWK